MVMRRAFHHFSRATACAMGHPLAFIGSLLLVAIWAATGPFFAWSDTHQLVINTTTTIITFWMVFVLQATQNSDTAAMHAKLDELVRAIPAADDEVRGIEQDA
jgi:low affinity Fe/Cu permease